MKNKGIFFEIAIAIFIFVLTYVFTESYQKPVIYKDGLGWDGGKYYNIAVQFANNHKPATNCEQK